MTNKDKRTGWLLNLKVGDEVFISINNTIDLKRVDRITPSGRIIIGKQTFDHYGIPIGDKDYWNRQGLVEATEERLEQYNMAVLRTSAIRLMLNTANLKRPLSKEHAHQIIQILSSYNN